MTLLLPTLAVAFAAYCVWLTVRVVNRKERWAKRTLAATLALPVLYVASFGPACRMAAKHMLSYGEIGTAYFPIIWISIKGPYPMRFAIERYVIISGGREAAEAAERIALDTHVRLYGD